MCSALGGMERRAVSSPVPEPQLHWSVPEPTGFRGRTARFGPAPERQVRDPTGFRNRTVASTPHPSACRLRLQLLMCLNNSMCQLPSASGATQVCSSSLPRTGPKGGAAARGSASTILLSLLFKNQAGRLAFVFVGRRAGLRKLAWRRPCQFYAKHTQWALSASGHLNEEEEHLCINSVISHSNGNISWKKRAEVSHMRAPEEISMSQTVLMFANIRSNISHQWFELYTSVVKSTDLDTIRYWNFKNVHFPLRFERCWADY